MKPRQEFSNSHVSKITHRIETISYSFVADKITLILELSEFTDEHVVICQFAECVDEFFQRRILIVPAIHFER
ncbi:hypothetical protein RHOFW510R12_07635 [Rhodanobacter sp. FW510-R12]